MGTAGTRAFGRGDTLSRAHLSEASFYDDLEKILAGVSEACEYGQIDIETTANGREKFYDLWQKAKNGLSPYTPIFIPWFIDNEYSIDSLTTEEREGLSVSVQELFNVKDTDFMAGIGQEERKLIARVKHEYGMDLTAGQLKWRRYKLWDKGDLFFQEYPEDDETCFLQSGRSVFKRITTNPAYKIPLDDPEKMASWKTEADREALHKRTLYGAVDGAEGTPTGDNHAFAVLDAPPEDPTARVIFEYVSNEPIDVFWIKVKKILDNYKIMLAIEKNGVGVAHTAQARKMGIRFIEWNTSGTNRPVMITQLEEAYRKEELVESYTEAEGEARNMIYTNNNRAEHPKGGNKHDDRIFARAIAWQIRKRPAPRVTSL